MRSFAFVAAFALAATPALAVETIHCADANGEVVVEYDIDRDASPHAVTRVEMQITGDIGISTDPTHEDYSGEDFAEQTIGNGVVDVTLRVGGTDGTYAMRLRLVEANEGRETSVTAGVLTVAGGGVWAVTCDGI